MSRARRIEAAEDAGQPTRSSSSQRVLTGALAAACGLLAACGGVSLHRTDVDKSLPDRVAGIAVGQSDRAGVRAQLGEPQLASHYWRFDLFRFSGRNSGIGMVYIVPFSMTTNIDASALVVYDRAGRVLGLDKGVNRAVPGWSWHEPPLMLKADAATVVSQVGRATSLYVAGERRNAYLTEARPRDRCTMVLGCDAERQCPAIPSVDGVAQQRLSVPMSADVRPGDRPPPPYPVRGWLLSLGVEPGEHRIEVRKGSELVADATVPCGAGELKYVRIGSPIQIASSMPTAFEDQPLLIYQDQWLLPQEPVHE